MSRKANVIFIAVQKNPTFLDIPKLFFKIPIRVTDARKAGANGTTEKGPIFFLLVVANSSSSWLQNMLPSGNFPSKAFRHAPSR